MTPDAHWLALPATPTPAASVAVPDPSPTGCGSKVCGDAKVNTGAILLALVVGLLIIGLVRAASRGDG